MPSRRRITRVVLGGDSPAGDGASVMFRTRPDHLAMEEPLQIRVDGAEWTTTMRSPGNDFELVHGLLHAEGVIRHREDVSTLRYCNGASGEARYNLIDVDLRRTRYELPLHTGITTSACGVCGTTSIEQVNRARRYAIRPIEPSASFIAGLPRLLTGREFDRTGGNHAAAAVTLDGQVRYLREDVGRHNAADKVIGAMLMADELPAERLILLMSSRASFELVQKAALAGFSGLVAVSAATDLAVDVARDTGMLLAGFTRGDRFNLYAGSIRREND